MVLSILWIKELAIAARLLPQHSILPSTPCLGTLATKPFRGYGSRGKLHLPANLLHELATHTQHHPPKMLRFPISEDGFERRAFAPSVTGSGDGVKDDLLLELAFFAIGLETTEGGDDGFALGVAASGEEPARGLGEPDHGDDEDESEDDLKGDGEAPY